MACETCGGKRARWGRDGGVMMLPSGAFAAAQCRRARRLLLSLSRVPHAGRSAIQSPLSSRIAPRRSALNSKRPAPRCADPRRSGGATLPAPAGARPERGRRERAEGGACDDRRERPSRAQGAVGRRATVGVPQHSLRGISAAGGGTRSPPVAPVPELSNVRGVGTHTTRARLHTTWPTRNLSLGNLWPGTGSTKTVGRDISLSSIQSWMRPARHDASAARHMQGPGPRRRQHALPRHAALWPQDRGDFESWNRPERSPV